MQKLISKISIYQIKRVYEKEGKIKTRKSLILNINSIEK